VVEYGVTIMGPTNLPASVPNHASQLYSRNLVNLLRIAVKDGKLLLETPDEIIRDSLVAHAGEVSNARVRELLAPSAAVTS
jgi:H+-translocating NAD(P) transhydrogenase subunit alpha